VIVSSSLAEIKNRDVDIVTFVPELIEDREVTGIQSESLEGCPPAMLKIPRQTWILCPPAFRPKKFHCGDVAKKDPHWSVARLLLCNSSFGQIDPKAWLWMLVVTVALKFGKPGRQLPGAPGPRNSAHFNLVN
jgi:hypothetical protein